MDTQDIYSYITSEETNYKTVRVPLTNSKDWNMHEHIERCTNVANGWFHRGKNDGERPYDDIVTPVINVAFRSEGFDVKDIVPYVEQIANSYKSFLVKKYHPKWARTNELDTLIDDIVESSVIYDLVLIKDVNNKRPDVIDLKTIAFCDQTNVLAGPIAIKHQYTISELTEYKGKWDDDKIDEIIVMSLAEKSNSIANDKKVKTPSKYITVYELRGMLPKSWIDPTAEPFTYSNQMHLVAFYVTKDGNKNGVTLYKGKDKKLSDTFKALKIDRIRSRGRACGKSIVETLFEPQVWNNYSAIKIKKLLDSALNVFVTDSLEYKDQKLTDLPDNTILGLEQGARMEKLESSLQNLNAFTNYQVKQENSARILGSASDAQLGTNPTSGTPFALQNLVVQQGQGLHEYRQGKIATFVADVLYRDLILKYLVEDMNKGVDFSSELSLDEIQEIIGAITENNINKKIKDQVLKTGIVPTEEERRQMKEVFKQDFMNKGKKHFMKILQGEIKDIPVDVFVNISSKQKQMAQYADKLSNLITNMLANIDKYQNYPGITKAFNELLENSGMSAIDFSPKMIQGQPQQIPQNIISNEGVKN